MSNTIIDDEVEKITQDEALQKFDEMKDLIHSDEFKDAIQKCTDTHVEILTTYKPEIKECKEDFADAAMACFSDLGKREKKKKSREFQTIFNKLHGFWDSEDENSSGETKIDRIATQVSNLIKWFAFLGDDRVKTALESRGIYLDDAKTEKIISEYPLTTGAATTMKSCLDDATTKNRKIREMTKSLAENLYADNVPTELQFDKDTNPIGLKPASFNKICKANAMKMTKSKEKADKYITDMAEKAAFNEATEQLIQESLAEILDN